MKMGDYGVDWEARRYPELHNELQHMAPERARAVAAQVRAEKKAAKEVTPDKLDKLAAKLEKRTAQLKKLSNKAVAPLGKAGEQNIGPGRRISLEQSKAMWEQAHAHDAMAQFHGDRAEQVRAWADHVRAGNVPPERLADMHAGMKEFGQLVAPKKAPKPVAPVAQKGSGLRGGGVAAAAVFAGGAALEAAATAKTMPPTAIGRASTAPAAAHNAVTPVPKLASKMPPAKPAAKPRGKGTKALGVLAPVALGALALGAANQAKAEGLGASGQIKAAAKEGAAGAGSMAAWTAGATGATYGLVRAGMTAAKAIPVVNIGMMAGGAMKGAWDARHDGGGAMLKSAGKGAWDMSLPGMVINTGLAAKEAIAGRMATPPHPASFQAAAERFQAMRGAAGEQAPEAKKKGWSNAARISAYEVRERKKGNPATNLPYGGAVDPPKPLKA